MGSGKRHPVSVPTVAREMAEFYRCGMSAPEIVYWMTTADEYRRRAFDRTAFGSIDGSLGLRRVFCGDCAPGYRMAMAKRGLCRESELYPAAERSA